MPCNLQLYTSKPKHKQKWVGLVRVDYYREWTIREVDCSPRFDLPFMEISGSGEGLSSLQSRSAVVCTDVLFVVDLALISWDQHAVMLQLLFHPVLSCQASWSDLGLHSLTHVLMSGLRLSNNLPHYETVRGLFWC